jgi:hypothetical protein
VACMSSNCSAADCFMRPVIRPGMLSGCDPAHTGTRQVPLGLALLPYSVFRQRRRTRDECHGEQCERDYSGQTALPALMPPGHHSSPLGIAGRPSHLSGIPGCSFQFGRTSRRACRTTSNPNIILGCALAILMARVEYSTRLDQK